MKKILHLLRHPRAAVVLHDLIMVAVAWLATGWVVAAAPSGAAGGGASP